MPANRDPAATARPADQLQQALHPLGLSGCTACLGDSYQVRNSPIVADDLLDVGLQGEVTGVDETNAGAGDVALEGFGSGRQEERIVPAPTASGGGLLARKYSWNAGQSATLLA
jgi:hypothetical protein